MIVVSFVLFALLIFAWLAAPDKRAARSPMPVPAQVGAIVHA
jgi:hypothetical protein